MLKTISANEPVSTLHRAKLAYVYIRQSSPGQIRHHQESTTLQYRLVERALTLGWPRDRITDTLTKILASRALKRTCVIASSG